MKSPNMSRPVRTRSTSGSTSKSFTMEATKSTTTRSTKKSLDKTPVKTVSKSTPRPAKTRQSSTKGSSDDISNIVSPLRRSFHLLLVFMSVLSGFTRVSPVIVSCLRSFYVLFLSSLRGLRVQALSCWCNIEQG